MYVNMQKFIKVCNNTSKYAENMQKFKNMQKQNLLILACFIVFLVSLGH